MAPKTKEIVPVFLNHDAEFVFRELEGASRQVSGQREMSDDDLMRAFQAGDVDAFEELVRRYRGKLTAFVAQRLGDGGLAEDFVQE